VDAGGKVDTGDDGGAPVRVQARFPWQTIAPPEHASNVLSEVHKVPITGIKRLSKGHKYETKAPVKQGDKDIE